MVVVPKPSGAVLYLYTKVYSENLTLSLLLTLAPAPTVVLANPLSESIRRRVVFDFDGILSS